MHAPRMPIHANSATNQHPHTHSTHAHTRPTTETSNPHNKQPLIQDLCTTTNPRRYTLAGSPAGHLRDAPSIPDELSASAKARDPAFPSGASGLLNGQHAFQREGRIRHE
jgi:hypothetical protein